MKTRNEREAEFKAKIAELDAYMMPDSLSAS